MPVSHLKHLALLLCVCILCSILPPVTALADPYPSHISVTVIDENTVLVTWQDNSWAQSYHVHRNEIVFDVAEDENSYLDTGLTPATPHCYRVCSVVDGVEYTADDTLWAAPLNTPVITSLELGVDYGEDQGGFRLSWTEVNQATGYVIFYKTDNMEEYESLGETLGTSNSGFFFIPDKTTTFWFKVRAFYKSEDGMYYYSSFSEPVSETLVIPFDFSRFRDLYLYEEVWPWPPWNKEWLGELLDVYGDPEKWPRDVVPGSKSLAGLAQHLSEGAALSDQEKQMVSALHPHGLVLLLGAFTSPPDAETAGVLTRQLQDFSLLLDKQTPDLLEGEALTKYYGQLKELCGLVSLKGTLVDASDALHPGFEVKPINTQDVIFSNLPGASSLLGGKLSNFSPTPSPSPEPIIVLRPGKVLTKPPVMDTPTPSPIRMPIPRP